MKKNDFDNRLQNDLFPEMPPSFTDGLKKAMQEAGVQTKKPPTAAGVFAGAVSLVAAAACLLIVLIGVMGGGKNKTNAAAPGEATVTPQMAQPTPLPMDQPTPMPLAENWTGNTKVIALSNAFSFENREKYEALYKGILRYLQNEGEAEPQELWLCAMKNRLVKEDTGHREDGYLNGYYVLAQHTFGLGEGPELYCLEEDGNVLWATEGSALGPNHAVHPQDDSYAALTQGHFLYGTEPMIAEPGVPHVKRGAVVGKEPGTDIEFSMAASITEVQNRLSAGGSAYPGTAREYFLMTVPAESWDYVMEAHTLRFETEEGPVDVDMETEIPLVNTLVIATSPAEEKQVKEVQQGVEQWLSQNQPVIRDLTNDWYGPEIIETYAEAIRRALNTSGEHIGGEIWICGVIYEENEAGTPPESAYVLAQYNFEGETGPELFRYRDGAIEWMTLGFDPYRINMIHADMCTFVFGKSPAYDNGPLAMTSGRLRVSAGGYFDIWPQLALDEVLQRVPDGPRYSAAGEYFLWSEPGEYAITTLSVLAGKNGQEKEYTLDVTNKGLSIWPVPAMAVESGGTVYPGRVTHMINSLNEDGVAAEGTPLDETMANGLLFKTTYTWQRPLTILTASDAVSVDSVDVYMVDDGNGAIQAAGQLDGADLDLAAIDALPPGEYYLCFRTTVMGPYSKTIGRYTFETDYTIYKVTLK